MLLAALAALAALAMLAFTPLARSLPLALPLSILVPAALGFRSPRLGALGRRAFATLAAPAALAALPALAALRATVGGPIAGGLLYACIARQRSGRGTAHRVGPDRAWQWRWRSAGWRS